MKLLYKNINDHIPFFRFHKFFYKNKRKDKYWKYVSKDKTFFFRGVKRYIIYEYNIPEKTYFYLTRSEVRFILCGCLNPRWSKWRKSIKNIDGNSISLLDTRNLFFLFRIKYRSLSSLSRLTSESSISFFIIPSR